MAILERFCQEVNFVNHILFFFIPKGGAESGKRYVKS